MKPQIAINLWLVAMCLALTVCVILLHREVRHLRECQQTMATAVSDNGSNIHGIVGVLKQIADNEKTAADIFHGLNRAMTNSLQ